MNFFKLHLGDYADATGHLSFTEDAAYFRMMRRYYSDEKPLPLSVPAICRLVKARTAAEKKAVKSVLDEFFIRRKDGFHNKRCDEEIASLQISRDQSRKVGKLGGRPKKQPNSSVSETRRVSPENPDGFFSKPGDNPLQNPESKTPEARYQNPELRERVGERASARIPTSPPGSTGKHRAPRHAHTRLPDDFVLTDTRRKIATDKSLDAEVMFAKFTTYYRAKGASAADWDSLWQHWCIKDAEQIAERDRPRKSSFELTQERLKKQLDEADDDDGIELDAVLNGSARQ